VRFEWDDRKSERNRVERGLPFEAAAAMFDGPVLEREDRRRDYGERRILATGMLAGRVLTCVYVDRVQGTVVVRRIISLRAAIRQERRDYVDHPEAP
jgi:uncharacterized protein